MIIAKARKFQFHFGSIGSPIESTKFFVTLPVSIPLWFDWKGALGFISRNSKQFQFHFGSIGSVLKTIPAVPHY